MRFFSMHVRVVGTAVAVVIAAGAVRAEDDGLCRAVPELSANPALTLGHISTAADRVHFIKDAGMQPGCPNAKPVCLARAYLVPGDVIIVSMQQPAFVCATYVDAKGGEWSGWLPAEAVALDSAAPVTPSGWIGTWSRTEAEIRVKAGKDGALRIEGDATYGATDPARVKRGGVNVGEISADVIPASGQLSFAMGEDATLLADKGDEFSCRVWMQRIGPWLAVDDNRHCGGFNVTFRGVYIRKR
jgi:hypothetical protein